MNKCICCESSATQKRDDEYHCDWCAKEYDKYRSYRDEGYVHGSAMELSGYLGRSPSSR